MTFPLRFILASLALHICVLVAGTVSTRSARQSAPPAEWVVALTTEIRSDVGREGQEMRLPVQVATLTSSTEDNAPQWPELGQTPLPAKENPVPPPSTPDTSQEIIASTAPPGASPAEAAPLAYAFQNTMNAQAILMQMRHFFRMASSTVKGMVDGALPAPDRIALDGERGQVIVTYRDGATIESLSINSNNDALKDFLRNKIAWTLAPSPKSCLLPFTTVTYSISFAGSRIMVAISPG